MAVSFVNTQQPRIDAWIQPGCRADIAVVSTESWPVDTVVTIGVANAAGVIAVPLLTITPDLATLTATVALTGVQVAALAVACPPPYGVIDWQWRTGAGSPLGVGSLHWDLTGARTTQTVTVLVGPAGPTAVSADAGNAATLGSDGLIFVSPTAGSAHVIRDEGAGVTDRPALDFRGVGVTVSDDPGSGATRVTISGGGASSLDDLTDVATAGADAGEALVSDGSGWVPSAAPVVLGTDSRLTDARPPTAHTHTLDATTDTATRVAMTPAERTKLAQQSGTNTGDQTWSTLSGKPAVVAAGADAAAARTAIGAGTSSLVLGTTAGTAAAGNDTRLSDARTPTAHNHAATEITSGTLATARLPAATDTAQGAVELATTAETTTGTDTTRAVTPAGVKASLDARAADYATAAQGALAATALQPATGQAINAQTGTSYTLVASDAGKVVTLTNAAAVTLTVPGSVFTTGQRVDCLVLGAGMVTAVGSSCTVNGTPSLVSRAQYSALTVLFTSATTAVVIGDLA